MMKQSFKNMIHYTTMEHNCELVSSRGLLKSCTFHHPNPQSSVDNVHEYLENDWNQEIMNQELVLEVDSLEIINQVPRRPQKEEEIQNDSFEGFLRGQFEKILATESPNNREFRVIEFESFLEWRIRMGVFLSRNEILDIFHSVVGQTEYCSIMEFIQINYLIDENRSN